MHSFQPHFEPPALPTVATAVAKQWQEVKLSGDQSYDALIILVGEEHLSNKDGVSSVNHPLLSQQNNTTQAQVATAAKLSTFKAKQGDTLPPVVLLDAAGQPCSLLLLGLGSYKPLPQWGQNAYHAAGSAFAAACKAHNLKDAHVAFHHLPSATETAAAITSFVSAAINGLYESTIRYRSKPDQTAHLQSLQLTLVSASTSSSGGSTGGESGFAAAAQRGVTLARGTLTTRYLVEAPANVCTPTYLAAAAQHIASLDPKHFSLVVLDEQQCRDLGMGLLVGVAQGSEQPLKLIHLTYKSDDAVKHKVALVVLDEQQCRDLGMGLLVGVAQGSEQPLKLIHLTYKSDDAVKHKVRAYRFREIVVVWMICFGVARVVAAFKVNKEPSASLGPSRSLPSA
eukprot:GHUV01041283.1.p1 GENE.GHUV01041283.1~~GHUV01041283.1.p1  ORF type:complete len:397 (+),score=119.51 GHUV01041283.1:265-1455(+)